MLPYIHITVFPYTRTGVWFSVNASPVPSTMSGVQSPTPANTVVSVTSPLLSRRSTPVALSVTITGRHGCMSSRATYIDMTILN